MLSIAFKDLIDSYIHERYSARNPQFGAAYMRQLRNLSGKNASQTEIMTRKLIRPNSDRHSQEPVHDECGEFCTTSLGVPRALAISHGLELVSSL